MASVDLEFVSSPIHQPADLIFGESFGPPTALVTLAATLPDMTVAVALLPVVMVDLSATLPTMTLSAFVATPPEVTLAATLPAMTAAIRLDQVAIVSMAATLPAPTFAASIIYSSNAARPLVRDVRTDWDNATGRHAFITEFEQSAAPIVLGPRIAWNEADPLVVGVDLLQPYNLEKLRVSWQVKDEEAAPLGVQVSTSFKNLDRSNRPAIRTAWDEAVRLQAQIESSWQERYRDRRPTMTSPWQEAVRLQAIISSGFGAGSPLVIIRRSWWDEAVVVPPGKRAEPPIPPIHEPCYIPPDADKVFLFFKDSPATPPIELIFVCETHPTPPPETIVVPIKRVYIVINSSSLKRVDDGTMLPTFNMSLSLDVNSWTWGFTANLPATTLDALMPASDGTPVELETMINGVPYRVLAEGLQRSRTFNQASITLAGRGKPALLDAPYAPVNQFINTTERTAQQLMNDALTVNGIPLGWEVEWNIDDWLVPANAWSSQGSYMGAVTSIAAAAGAYIQPHATLEKLIVLHKYPTAPWDWASVVPDYELPADVMTQEGITWTKKPSYNRVYVSGTSAGIVGQVTRDGTAGDFLAPMVSDQLITETPAARQRGRAVLSDTGKQADVNLRLPVLLETGIILPGKFVRYVDGAATKIGIVRSTNVSVQFPETWQTIGVETHVD